MQISLCMTRGWHRLLQDQAFFVITVLGSLVVSIILGSVFFDLPDTAESINTRCILIFVAVLFNALKSALEIFSLYAQRPIVEKHSRYALYHPFAEAIASSICDLPSKILSTIAFNIPLYFMAKLRMDTGAFFIFFLFGFMATLAMSMILRTIGQTTRSVHQALTPAAIFIVMLIVYTGYILPVPNMQGWLRWINYLNPIAYAFEAMLANELHDRNFPCTMFVPMGPPYANATAVQRACAVPGALPGQDFVNGDMLIGAAYGYYHSNMWRNCGILIAFAVFFCAVYILAAEYLLMGQSKGEILVFRRGVSEGTNKTEKQRAQDEESGESDGGALGRMLSHASGVSGRRAASQGVAGGTLQRDNAIFHWRDVCYDIDIKGEKRRILNHVDGWVKPGTLTALMVRLFSSLFLNFDIWLTSTCLSREPPVPARLLSWTCSRSG